jgi:hypothetical protein
MIKYNFTTKALTNESVQSVYMAGENEMGGMHFVPTYGPQGILVTLGGDQVGKVKAGSDALLNMTYVQVFDPAQGKWYEQKTTGYIPKARKEFCVAGAASTNKTYEILVYAGWDGNLGPAAIPYDEAYVLTLPGFFWVRAEYDSVNPRHGLSCNAVGGGQVLTIGGLNTTQNGPGSLYNAVFDTQDQFSQGLAVFNMTSLSFQSSYVAKPGPYVQAKSVQAFYLVK